MVILLVWRIYAKTASANRLKQCVPIKDAYNIWSVGMKKHTYGVGLGSELGRQGVKGWEIRRQGYSVFRKKNLNSVLIKGM